MPKMNKNIPTIFNTMFESTVLEFESPWRYPLAKVNENAEKVIYKGTLVWVLRLSGYKISLLI